MSEPISAERLINLPYHQIQIFGQPFDIDFHIGGELDPNEGSNYDPDWARNNLPDVDLTVESEWISRKPETVTIVNWKEEGF